MTDPDQQKSLSPRAATRHRHRVPERDHGSHRRPGPPYAYTPWKNQAAGDSANSNGAPDQPGRGWLDRPAPTMPGQAALGSNSPSR
ncbi:hypothetical protein [Bradyrhizobium sp. STM 3562]|uniref:hypothetical protein n=1 Tax=Bradyrhizobium sp. STM 3562 TaxID=578924 RepID=UPI00388F0D8A